MNKLLNSFSLRAVFTLSLAALLTAAQTTPPHTPVELSHLQGHWQGTGAGGKCSITITNNTLHYRAGTNWWKTTFTLPPGTNPQQLHATIKDSAKPPDGNGQIVYAIIKIENQILTLATYGEDPPKTFADATEPNLYTLKKVQDKKPEPSK
jgi:hypothetical protein